MKTSKAGLNLIKSFEGLSLKSYLCPAKVLTIGYGSTGKHVKKDMTITESEAETLLSKDLIRFENGVKMLVKTNISQNQFDALVSFAFNLGLGSLEKSTLLKKVNKDPNDETIKDEFLKWTKSGGVVLKGLVKRRTAEAKLYFS